MDKKKVIAKVREKLAVVKDKDWEKKLVKELASKLEVIEGNLNKTFELCEKYGDFLKENGVKFTSDDTLGKYVGSIIKLTEYIQRKADKWEITHR